MNRTPPLSVRRALRREVGFGCPVPECGNPYLSYHHYDPPWHVKEHHEVVGMIALCAEHHDKADAGAYTEDQLREFKRDGAQRNTAVRGRFDWMRYDLLVVLGNNFCVGAREILTFCGDPVIWLNRDADGYLLLNIDMLTQSGEPRTRIQDNSWMSRGLPTDLESPPSGKKLRCQYENGDLLSVEFCTLVSPATMRERYPDSQPIEWNIRFPITAVEVTGSIGGVDLSFSPKEIRTPVGVRLENGFCSGIETVLHIAPERPPKPSAIRLPLTPELKKLQRSSSLELALRCVTSRTLENELIVIDDTTFERCTFNNCRLIYMGGDYALHGNVFNRCEWQFTNEAAKTVSFLHELYKMGYTDMIETTLKMIRGE